MSDQKKKQNKSRYALIHRLGYYWLCGHKRNDHVHTILATMSKHMRKICNSSGKSIYNVLFKPLF